MEVDLLKAILESEDFKNAFKHSFESAVMIAELNTLQAIQTGVNAMLDVKKTNPNMTNEELLMVFNEYLKMWVDKLKEETGMD